MACAILYLICTSENWESSGWYERENGLVEVAGIYTCYIYGVKYVEPAHDSYRTTGFEHMGVWLINDRGLTRSSKANPNINLPAY